MKKTNTQTQKQQAPRRPSVSPAGAERHPEAPLQPARPPRDERIDQDEPIDDRHRRNLADVEETPPEE